MKVEKIDILWSVISVFIVGISYRKDRLIYGLLLIYGLMVILFLYHIFKIRRSISGSIAVYGTITGYRASETKTESFPIVKYETETGREITSVYTVGERKQRYEIGDEEMICYDPDNPMFFYFANREDELTRDYFRFIIFGGIIAALLFIIAQTK